MSLRRVVLAVTLVLVATVVLAGIVPGLAEPSVSPYRFVTYDAPGWHDTELWGINNLGLLTGIAYNDDESTFTGLVGFDGRFSFVNVPDQGPLGTILYQANDLGQVAGNYWDANGIAHAIVYDTIHNRFEHLPDIPGATFNAAGGIAITGETSGVYTTDPQQLVNYVGWLHTGGKYEDFIAPQSDQALFGTATYCMNNALTIVGYYLDASGVPHGYVKPRGGPILPTDVPVAGALGTLIVGINNSGAIAGQYADARGGVHGFVLKQGRFTTVDYPGATLTGVFAINDLGDIAGTYNDAQGNQHGFVGWTH